MNPQPTAPQIYPQVVKQTEINENLQHYLFWKCATDILQKMKEQHPSVDFSMMTINDLILKQFEEFALIRKIRSNKAEKEKLETAKMLKRLDNISKTLI